MNFTKSLRPSILQTSAGAPLKSKIFTGVSFRVTLGICFKRSRQLFYYKRTSSFEMPEPVNAFVFQNSSESLLLKIPQQTKISSKSTTKECLRNAIRVFLKLAGKIFFKSVTQPNFRKSSGLYINSSEWLCDRVCNGSCL